MESSGTRARVLVWLCAIVASAVLAKHGFDLLRGTMVGQFEEWGYAPGFSITIGALELLGAAVLLIPSWSARAALGLLAIMFGALGMQLLEGDWVAALAPIGMIVLLATVLEHRSV